VQADFWHARWRDGRIGFQQSTIAPSLTEYWPMLDLPHGSPVFVPLCGKSLDLLWLRDRQHSVVGVELSAVAVESFFMENAILAGRAAGKDFDEFHAPGLRLLCGDFFQLTPQMLDTCVAVYDRAALIAWPPEFWTRYVEKIAQLTASGSQTLLITLEYPQAQMPGPPFSVDGAAVNRLYSAHHEIRLLNRADILASDPKLQARGITSLHEVCYHLTRL
jgi:thiopurine S-methyltransferase